jgi:hypothetical protein
MASQGGIIVELDGSIPDSYIRERKVVALIPKVPAFFSMMGSSYIVYSLVGTERSRDMHVRLTFDRLLLALSIADISSFFALFLSSWPNPKEADGGYKQYAWDIEFPYAAGNQATCSFQGFLVQFGFLRSVFVIAYMSLSFLFQVRYRWIDASMRRAETAFFVVGIVLPLASAIIIVSLGVLAPATNAFCWMNPSNPYNCWTDDHPFCTDSRKSNTDYIYNIQLYGGFLWILLSVILVIVSIVLLFLTDSRCARKKNE